jgi:Fe2+ or Zn2+ uptake regulation protein
MHSPKKIFKVYKKRRLTLTPERRLVIELLHEDTSHPSIDEIHQKAKQHMPDISRTMVYNTITELEIFGEIERLNFVDGNNPRFDPNVEPHNHLYCSHCHEVIDIEIDSNEINIDPEKFSGFQIDKTQITFYGICPGCQES